MEIALDVARTIVPFALRLARNFINSQVAKGGVTPSEAALVALFDAVVAYIDAQET